MALRVTKPITKNGRYYAAGEMLDAPTSKELSMGRLYGWESIRDPKPPLSGLRKSQLIEVAESRGLDVEGLTVPEIKDAIEADE